MALVRVGVFATAGYTEVGGLDVFLPKINPHVQWDRCFPTVDKPAPKLGRQRPVPTAAHNGVTGQALVDAMIDRLRRFHRGANLMDAVLLVDDADCRFEGVAKEGYDAWMDDTARAVREAAASPDLPFFALFASPEVECWFVADWGFGFGGHVGKEWSHVLKRRVDVLLDEAGCRDQIEAYGCPSCGQSCTHKLSDRIVEILADEGFRASSEGAARPSYSKRLHGSTLLRHVRPEQIDRLCRLYFHDTFRALAGLHG